MTVANISWYLFVVFIFALGAESVVTVAPGGETLSARPWGLGGVGRFLCDGCGEISAARLWGA